MTNKSEILNEMKNGRKIYHWDGTLVDDEDMWVWDDAPSISIDSESAKELIASGQITLVSQSPDEFPREVYQLA